MASTRDKLLSAATDLLDHAGPEGVTLRAVGAAAGVSHNAPYKHFPDKEALLAAVAAKELQALDASMRHIAADTSNPLDRLRAVAREHIAWATQCPRRFRLVFGSWSRHDDGLHVAATAARQTLLDAVVFAQHSDAIRSAEPEQVAALLMATAHGAVDMYLSGHLASDGKGQSTPEALLEELIDLLRCESRID